MYLIPGPKRRFTKELHETSDSGICNCTMFVLLLSFFIMISINDIIISLFVIIIGVDYYYYY